MLFVLFVLAFAISIWCLLAIQHKKQVANVTKTPGRIVAMESMSKPGKQYQCNVDALMCTCPDWTKTRFNQARETPGRLCKHLVKCVANDPEILPDAMKQFFPLIKFFAKEKHGMHFTNGKQKAHYGITENGVPFLISKKRSGDWTNLYFDRVEYGYNKKKMRWARGLTPADSWAWEKRMDELIGQ